MGSESVDVCSEQTDRVFAALSSEHRRLALAVLAEEASPIAVEELVTRVATAVEGGAVGNVDGDVAVDHGTRERMQVSLVHRHVPKLVAADLVRWDRDAGVVATTGSVAYEDPRFRRVLDSPRASWDDVLTSLAHARRRVVLSVLVEHGSAIGRRNLAHLTVARERGVPRESVPSTGIDDALVSLHHVHLPKLRDAGLVVDDGLETVRYAGHPELDEASLSLDTDEVAPTLAPVAH